MRRQALALLGLLPALPVALDRDVLQLIEGQALMGRGLGYLNSHLLASTLVGRARLWTRDRRLWQVATDLAVACSWA